MQLHFSLKSLLSFFSKLVLCYRASHRNATSKSASVFVSKKALFLMLYNFLEQVKYYSRIYWLFFALSKNPERLCCTKFENYSKSLI